MNDDPRSDGPHIDDTARRVQDAVTAHGRSVQPDEDGSLPVIRQRVASARRRRLAGATALGAAAALVIGVAIGVAAGGDDTTTVAVGDGGSTTTTGPCPPSTPSSSTTTTTAPSTASIPTTSTAPTDSAAAGGSSTTIVPANAPLTAVPETTIPAPGQSDEELTEDRAEENCAGPTTGTVPTTGTTTTAAPSTTIVVADPASVIYPVGLPLPPDQVPPVAWRSPQGIAKAYLDHLGATRVELSAYDSVRKQIVVTSSNAPSGAVGARSILTVVPVTGLACGPDGTCYETWAVQEARSPAIVVERAEVQPPADGQGHWTLALAGRARGFEGTIHVTVTGNGDVAWSAEDVVTASGGEELAPFSTFVDLGQPPVGTATVVLANESGEDGSPVDITAFPIQIAVP